MLAFVDKRLFLDKPEPPVIGKPGRPCLTEGFLALYAAAGPVNKPGRFVKEIHNPIEVMIVPGEIPFP